MWQFSTKDNGPKKTCASSKGAGWWYGYYDGCNGRSNLNAPFYNSATDVWDWENFAHWRSDGDQEEKQIFRTIMGFKKKGEVLNWLIIIFF